MLASGRWDNTDDDDDVSPRLRRNMLNSSNEDTLNTLSHDLSPTLAILDTENTLEINLLYGADKSVQMKKKEKTKKNGSSVLKSDDSDPDEYLKNKLLSYSDNKSEVDSENESGADSPIKKKKKKGGNRSLLLDDSDDELLKDVFMEHTNMEPGSCKEDNMRVTDDDSDASSIGLPDDMYILSKSDEPEVKKQKKQQFFKDKEGSDHDDPKYQKSKKDKSMEPKKSKKSKAVVEELDAVQQLVSDRQRMLRESDIRLPRHEPAPLQLTDCLSRIPKLKTIQPISTVLLHDTTKNDDTSQLIQPKLSNKNDDFFLPKALGNFMNRFKKHLSFSAKLTNDPKTPCANNPRGAPTLNQSSGKSFKPANHTVPPSLISKQKLQSELQEKILTKKLEARRAAEQERQVDEERFVRADTELDKLLDNAEEEDVVESSCEEDENEDENEENENEEDENEVNIDEVIDKRAEKILLGEDVSSSENEEQGKERNYHTDTDSDLLASADEVHVDELPPDSASDDDLLQPSRYSLRRLTRYVRKRRLTKKPEPQDSESEVDDEKQEKVEKARKRIETLLAKRKEIVEKKREKERKRRELEEKKREMEEVIRQAELAAAQAIENKPKKTAPKPKTTLKSIERPWLSESDEDLPDMGFEASSPEVSNSFEVPTSTGMSAQRPSSFNKKRDSLVPRTLDDKLEARAAQILAGEDISSSDEEAIGGEKEKKYHTDTDSDLLASADEVHVDELPPDSASEDDLLQPSRYSLRRLTRYCRKKRLARRKQHNVAPVSDEEAEAKEARAKQKLKALLQKRGELKKQLQQKSKRENRYSYSSTLDLFSNAGDSLSAGGSGLVSSTIIPDSLDTLPVSEKTFDVDTAARAIVEESQHQEGSFLHPDEDAVFLDTQGVMRSEIRPDNGGIQALQNSQHLDTSSDLMNMCSGVFTGHDGLDKSGSSELGTVNLHNFNLESPIPAVKSSGRITTSTLSTPSSKPVQGESQTPLTRFGALFSQGLVSHDDTDTEEDDSRHSFKTKNNKKGGMRKLYNDMFDDEAEKSGSDHSDDENEEGLDGGDLEGLLAKESEVPSDEEELANQLKHAYHEQINLQEKEQLKRLKERYIQENAGFFRTRKFHAEDANLDLFSNSVKFDDENEEDDLNSEEYKLAMKRREERLKREQFVREKQEGVTDSAVDDESQAFLDSLQDITESSSRSTFSSAPQCGSFLKTKSDTLSRDTLTRLSSITSLHTADKAGSSNKGYVFQAASPRNPKRSRPSNQYSQSQSAKRPKASEPPKTAKSIFNMII